MRYIKKIWLWILATVFGLGVVLAAQPSVADCIADTNKQIHERIETCPVPANERASFKGKEIAKIGAVAKVRRPDGFDGYIEITDIQEREGGVEVFARAWDKNNQQIGFGDGTVDIERFIIINPPILVDDPNGTITREIIDPDTGETIIRKLREDTQEAVLQVLAHTIKVKKQKFGSEKIQAGKRGNTTLTAFPNAGTGTAPIDGRVVRDAAVASETFTALHDNAGNGHNDTTGDMAGIQLRSTATTDEFDVLYRAGMGWDTSSIGTDDVDSVVVSIWVNSFASFFGGDNVNFAAFTPADGSDFVNADYNIANHGGTNFVTGIAIGSLTTGAYNDFTANASGEADINKSGNTFWAMRWEDDIANSFGGTWAASKTMEVNMSFADIAGTTQDPKLVVEHSAAAATPQTPQIINWVF